MAFPTEFTPIFQNYITCEYASITKTGTPITMPVTPYLGVNNTIDVSTGLVYPAKAERARRNPKVAQLFSDPRGSGVSTPHTLLVIGDACVRDRDLQANTDRYIRDSMEKIPDMMHGFPRFLVKMQAWYWVRIWIEVTPRKILWWRGGDLDAQPEVWINPAAGAPVSDPSPNGLPPKPWKDSPQDWRTGASRAVQTMGKPVLTVVGSDGYPLLLRSRQVGLTPEGFTLTMPAGTPPEMLRETPACLTFHQHPDRFTGQENMLFIGTITRVDGNQVQFHVERRSVDWSGGGAGRFAKVFGTISFLNAGIRLTPRLRREAERRGQPVPEIHIP